MSNVKPSIYNNKAQKVILLFKPYDDNHESIKLYKLKDDLAQDETLDGSRDVWDFANVQWLSGYISAVMDHCQYKLNDFRLDDYELVIIQKYDSNTRKYSYDTINEIFFSDQEDDYTGWSHVNLYGTIAIKKYEDAMTTLDNLYIKKLDVNDLAEDVDGMGWPLRKVEGDCRDKDWLTEEDMLEMSKEYE